MPSIGIINVLRFLGKKKIWVPLLLLAVCIVGECVPFRHSVAGPTAESIYKPSTFKEMGAEPVKMTTLEATLETVAQDPGFSSFGIADKMAYLQSEVLPKADPGFKTLSVQDQRTYIGQVILPAIKQFQTQRAFSGQFSKQGQATYEPEDYYQQVAADPDFEGLSIADKVSYLQNDVLPLFDNDFKQLDATQQRDYIGQHVLPYIKQIKAAEAGKSFRGSLQGPEKLKPYWDLGIMAVAAYFLCAGLWLFTRWAASVMNSVQKMIIAIALPCGLALLAASATLDIDFGIEDIVRGWPYWLAFLLVTTILEVLLFATPKARFETK